MKFLAQSLVHSRPGSQPVFTSMYFGSQLSFHLDDKPLLVLRLVMSHQKLKSRFFFFEI